MMHDCPLLVVDDDDNIRGMVADILMLGGYAVVIATNGQEALATIDAIRASDPECPRVVLLDMRMPVLDGWGSRANYGTVDLPFPSSS